MILNGKSFRPYYKDNDNPHTSLSDKLRNDDEIIPIMESTDDTLTEGIDVSDDNGAEDE